MEKLTQERGGFKVGDRVKLVGPNSSDYPQGAVGTIMEIWAVQVPWPFYVKLDDWPYDEAKGANALHPCSANEIAKIEE